MTPLARPMCTSQSSHSRWDGSPGRVVLGKSMGSLKMIGPSAAWIHELWDIWSLQDGTVEQSFGGGLVVASGYSGSDNILLSSLTVVAPFPPLFHVGKLASMRTRAG